MQASRVFAATIIVLVLPATMGVSCEPPRHKQREGIVVERQLHPIGVRLRIKNEDGRFWRDYDTLQEGCVIGARWPDCVR